MSRVYEPDKWVILEMNMEGEKIKKVLGGWQGGYLDGDSWRLSSGTLEIEEEGDYYIFKQHSGSVYKCHKNTEGLTMLMSSMLSSWQEQLKEKENSSIELVGKND